jgi:hypothetical protein
MCALRPKRGESQISHLEDRLLASGTETQEGTMLARMIDGEIETEGSRGSMSQKAHPVLANRYGPARGWKS